jgi:hypothetical protein
MARAKGTPKSGGRSKGTPNKVTERREAEIAASGLTPLEYMLGILRDPKQDQSARFAAAEKAAPYCHAKLAAVTIGGDPDNPVVHEVLIRGVTANR